MKNVYVDDVGKQLAQTLTHMKPEDEQAIIDQEGTPLAYVISPSSYEVLQQVVEYEEDRLDIEASDKVMAGPDQENISWEEVKAEMERKHALSD